MEPLRLAAVAGLGLALATGLAAFTPERALKLAEREWGPRHLRIVPALQVLARDRMRRGRYEEAARDLRRALVILDRRWGGEDARVLDAWTEYARALVRAGHWTRVEPCLRRVHGRQMAGRGIASAPAAEAWTVRALLHLEREELGKAGEALGRAEAIRRGLAEKDPAGLGEVLHLLGRRALMTGELPAAETYLTSALEIRKKRKKAPWQASYTRGLQARLAQLREDRDDARKLYDQALSELAGSVGVNHPRRLRLLGWSAELALETALAAPYPSDKDLLLEARLAAEAVLARALRSLNDQHPDFGRHWRLVARIYLEAGRPKPAVPYLRRTLQLERKQLGKNHPRTLAVQRLLRRAERERRVVWKREVTGPEG